MREYTASIRRHRWSRRRTHWSVAFVAFVAMAAAPDAFAADPSPNEVEARFVYQLLNYVTWPEAALPAGAPLQVGVLGDDGFAAQLREVVGERRAQDHSVRIRTVVDGAEAGLHLLFVREPDSTKLRDLARLHHGASVLVVADRFDFPKLGGDVGIELVGGRVSFSINRRKSERGDLVISSKLLRLASEVK